MRYYLLINVGALVGQISMVYAEKYVVRLLALKNVCSWHMLISGATM
jgi:hypothetical protein